MFFGLFVFVFGLVCGKTHNTICVGRHHTQEKDEDKQNKKHNTICVGHHHAQEKDEDKQNKKHNAICVGHHHAQDQRRRQTK
jgi:ABC-type nickel/cobalt efflux system permease component RcnA